MALSKEVNSEMFGNVIQGNEPSRFLNVIPECTNTAMLKIILDMQNRLIDSQKVEIDHLRTQLLSTKVDNNDDSKYIFDIIASQKETIIILRDEIKNLNEHISKLIDKTSFDQLDKNSIATPEDIYEKNVFASGTSLFSGDKNWGHWRWTFNPTFGEVTNRDQKVENSLKTESSEIFINKEENEKGFQAISSKNVFGENKGLFKNNKQNKNKDKQRLETEKQCTTSENLILPHDIKKESNLNEGDQGLIVFGQLKGSENVYLEKKYESDIKNKEKSSEKNKEIQDNNQCSKNSDEMNSKKANFIESTKSETSFKYSLLSNTIALENNSFHKNSKQDRNERKDTRETTKPVPIQSVPPTRSTTASASTILLPRLEETSRVETITAAGNARTAATPSTNIIPRNEEIITRTNTLTLPRNNTSTPFTSFLPDIKPQNCVQSKISIIPKNSFCSFRSVSPESTPSYSKKHYEFVSKPINSQGVTSLPGIGNVLGSRLASAGYGTARSVQEKFEEFGGNQEKFEKWLYKTTNANSKQRRDCYNALNY